MEKTVRYLRQALPYINEHRDKRMLVLLPHAIVSNSTALGLVEDLALLNNLGIQLIIVPCAEAPTETNAAVDEPHFATIRENIEQMWFNFYSNCVRIQLPIVQTHFSTGRSLGIIKGEDKGLRGVTRHIDKVGLENALNANQIIWQSPIAYSPSGSVYLLNPFESAIKIAQATKASKLITYFDPKDFPRKMARQYQPKEIMDHPHPLLKMAYEATRYGIPRVHLLNAHQDGSLLIEMYTRDGAGILINKDDYDTIRPAHLEDIPYIEKWTAPLQNKGVLIDRTTEDIARHINDYQIMLRDGTLVGCLALHDLGDESCELACLVVSEDARRLNLGSALLDKAELTAKNQQQKQLFVLTTQAIDWFIERGFKLSSPSALPKGRSVPYNTKRNAKVLCKPLK